MARTIGSTGERTEAVIRACALRLMARYGYEAMSMRRLASEVGVQAAALYRYFPTKQDLLYTLLHDHMSELLASWHAVRPRHEGPRCQLAAYVANHVRFHVERRHSTHVSNLELRALSPDRMSEILKLRATYEKELRRILREGAEVGLFDIDDVTLTSMAIIQMITGVIVWFRPGERLSVEQVTNSYHAMTMRLVGVDEYKEATDDVRTGIAIRAG